MSDSVHEDTLQAALNRHAFTLPTDQVARLDQYVRLVWTWNQRLNLTRHLDFETFVARDLSDSWQLAQLLGQGERILDVGTGGGVPGIVLAVLRPDLQVTLCESVGKKAVAVAAIVRELTLPIAVHAGPVQELLSTGCSFDTLVARAVGPLWKILKWLKPHWGSFGRLLLIKGPKWTEERGQARHLGYLTTLELRCVASYATAGHFGESVILAIYPGAKHAAPQKSPEQEAKRRQR
jgi:16S rRNA (guanine527-N7)-methyltransferase